MRVPPLLLGATTLFWGWQCGAWLAGGLLAVVVEGVRIVPWRWELDDRDFNRIADLSAVLFLGLIYYQYDTYAVHGIFGTLRWLPLVLLPLLAAQLYSTREAIRYSTLFISIRRAEARGRMADAGAIDLRYPFLALCLLSASAGTADRSRFYAGLCLLVVWALWGARSRRYSPVLWGAVMVLSLAGGMGIQSGILKTRAALEPIVLEWLQERLWQMRDPYRTQTVIGEIGDFKSSDRILMRVDSPRSPPPALLREASYRTYSTGVWLAGSAQFSTLNSDIEGTTWALQKGVGPFHVANISQRLRRGKGLLALPGGTHRLAELPVEELKQNTLGAVTVTNGPDLIEYVAHYRPDKTVDRAADETDLQLPGRQRALFTELVDELGLRGLEAEVVIARISAYFKQHFSYTLVQRKSQGLRPLAYFLQESRRGHCEYFATATVLLLRAAGIPARYATGYSVQEYSNLEERFVVRRRHAHSWALVEVNGQWRDLDTTPAVWAPLEAEAASSWEPLYDFLAWLRYRFTRWRVSEGGLETRWLPWLALPLFLFLLWRLRSTRRQKRAEEGPLPQRPAQTVGVSSDYYQIEAYLRANDLVRPSGETPQNWLRQLGESHRLEGMDEVLLDILPTHYRWRFDPQGLDARARQKFSRRVQAWMTQYATKRPYDAKHICTGKYGSRAMQEQLPSKCESDPGIHGTKERNGR